MYMPDVVCQHTWEFRLRDVPNECNICSEHQLAHRILLMEFILSNMASLYQLTQHYSALQLTAEHKAKYTDQ